MTTSEARRISKLRQAAAAYRADRLAAARGEPARLPPRTLERLDALLAGTTIDAALAERQPRRRISNHLEVSSGRA